MSAKRYELSDAAVTRIVAIIAHNAKTSLPMYEDIVAAIGTEIHNPHRKVSDFVRLARDTHPALAAAVGAQAADEAWRLHERLEEIKRGFRHVGLVDRDDVEEMIEERLAKAAKEIA